MSKKMLINASHPEENRVAIVVDGILSELDIEIAGQEQSKGNIYKAVVVRVETGLQAAFVDYGAEKLGFLQIGEIHPNLYPKQSEDSKRRPRIAEILQRGQEILVQIVKEERGNKGAALTTYLSIPGRYMVLMPDSTTKGVSRKISLDSERRNLKKTMAELDLPERMGYIVRTAGIGKDKDELKRDFDYLVRLFEGIVARKDQIKAPAQLYQESNLAIRSIRDYFSTEMDEVLVDDAKVFQDTRDFFSLVMPELKHLVKRHRERRPIFSRYQIEEQIEGLSRNQAPLPSGGSIVIDQTEALVAIDVNSGKMSGESGIEATAYKTNMEAAAEVGRQLRLRDLGGLVVIDFIDMRDRKNIRDVEQQLRKSLRDDKAKVSVGRISQFGLMEMSRQRLKPVLSVGAYLECPHCKGIGRIKSIEAQAIAFLRQAHTAAAKGQIGHIEASVPLEVANHLLNQKRSTIVELERQLNLKISLIGSCDLLPGEIRIELHKREKEADDSREIMPVSHDNQIEIALAAAQQSDAKETEEPAEQNEPEEAEEKSKKRRRRRRKKPAAKTPEQPSQDVESGDSSPAAGGETSRPTDEVQPEITAEENSSNAEETVEEKPKPRSRGRRRAPAKKKDVVQEQAEAAAQEKPEATEAAAPQPDSAPQTENSPAQPQTAETTADKVLADSPADDEKPKRRRPRRTTRKTQSAETGEQTTAKSTIETPAAGEAAPQAEEHEAVKTAEKPKRRATRTTRKAQQQAPEATPAETGETATPAEKPKRRTRRTPLKKDADEQSSASPVVATQAETDDAEKPKPRRRRTAKKTAETSDAEIQSADSGAEPVTKPKRKPRTTAKKTVKKTSDAADIPDQDESAATEKPKRRPRRATPKKKPAETDDTPAGE